MVVTWRKSAWNQRVLRTWTFQTNETGGAVRPDWVWLIYVPDPSCRSNPYTLCTNPYVWISCSMMVQCWANVEDVGPALNHHLTFYLKGVFYRIFAVTFLLIKVNTLFITTLGIFLYQFFLFGHFVSFLLHGLLIKLRRGVHNVVDVCRPWHGGEVRCDH